MRPGAALRTCLLDRYATFSGRAGRAETWWLAGVMALGTALALAADALTLPGTPPLLAPVFLLLTAPPGLAATWRRMHDIGRPGWHILKPGLATVATLSLLLAIGDALDPGAIPASPAALTLLACGALLLTAAIAAALTALRWLAAPGDTGLNPYGPPPA